MDIMDITLWIFFHIDPEYIYIYTYIYHFEWKVIFQALFARVYVNLLEGNGYNMVVERWLQWIFMVNIDGYW